jgi:hypothetical protein
LNASVLAPGPVQRDHLSAAPPQVQPVADLGRKVLEVVDGDHQLAAPLRHSRQGRPQLPAAARVEAGEGLVQQQQARLFHDGARQEREAKLAVGHLPRPAARQPGEPDRFERYTSP